MILESSFILPLKPLVSIFSHRRTDYRQTPFNMFNAFSLIVWLLILLSVILFATLQWINQCINIHRAKWSFISMVDSYFVSIAVMLGQGWSDFKQKKHFQRNAQWHWKNFSLPFQKKEQVGQIKLPSSSEIYWFYGFSPHSYWGNCFQVTPQHCCCHVRQSSMTRLTNWRARKPNVLLRPIHQPNTISNRWKSFSKNYFFK